MGELSVKVQGTEEIVRNMVSKAAFAYAYISSYDGSEDEWSRRRRAELESEYLSVSMCVAMLVTDSYFNVCKFVQEVAKDIL